MTKFGSAIFTLVIIVLGIGMARAQESSSPESTRLVKELIEVTGGKQQFNDIVSGTMSFQNEQTRQTLNDLFKDDKVWNAADKARFSEITEDAIKRVEARSKEFFTTKFDFEKFVIEVYVPVYTKHFTDGELREMIAFYRTPTGQKASKETPQLMTDSMAAISKTLLPAFTEYIKQVLDDESTVVKQELSTKKSSSPK